MLNMGSINVNATSRIEETDVVYFSASFSPTNGGNYNVSKNISNIALYETNKESCDMDYELFEQKAKQMVEQTMGIFE